MNAEESVDHPQLSELLVSLALGVDASELHGSLCGFLCGGGQSDAGRWLRDLAITEPDAPNRESGAESEQLRRVFEQTRLDLLDPELRFSPMLPDDDNPIEQRCAALTQWCRGFLGGLGMAGFSSGEDLSEECGEVLQDLYRIGASELTLGDQGKEEEDEAALTDILEYVRMGVLLIYSELRRSPKPSVLH